MYLLNIIPDTRNLCFAKNKKIHHILVEQSRNFQREWKCQPVILSNVIYVNFIRYSRVILLLKLHMKIVFSSSGKPRKPQRLTPTFEPEVWPDKTTEETSWEDKLTPRCHCFKKSFPSWASVPCCCQKSPCEQPQQSAPRMRQMEEELQPASAEMLAAWGVISSCLRMHTLACPKTTFRLPKFKYCQA